MDGDDLKECIKHLSHPHPLTLVQLVPADHGRSSCFVCCCCKSNYWIIPWTFRAGERNVMYACRESECNPKGIKLIGREPRGAYLCVSCAQLEESLERNALHPHHPRLKLSRTTGECNACCRSISTNFSYRCEEEKCNFQMHLRCAHSLKPTLSLPCHPHLLALVSHDYPTYKDDAMNCESCRLEIQIPRLFARCVPCNLNYHIWCSRVDYNLPCSIIDVERHPQHHLSRNRSDSYWSCGVCYKRDWPNEQVYACLDCNNFTAHLSCMFLSSLPCPSANLVTNNLTDLIIKDGSMREGALCQGCKKRILNNGVPIYGCHYCDLFLHETCIRGETMEDKVEGHPGYDVHHEYPHVLVFSHGVQYFLCVCCQVVCVGFMFRGYKRDEWLVLHLECMLVVPSLELIGHDHPVVLLQDSKLTKNSYLRCLQCRISFRLTESSCRFPRTVVHECHLHPLTLVENNDDGQCYCDACEGERDPNECFYYCVECKFEVHTACVKSEVLGPLANKLKDVKFVTLQEIFEGEKGKEKKIQIRDVFILEKVLKLSHTHVEKELDDIIHGASEIAWKNSIGENPSYDDEFLNKILYSDGPFKLFIEKLYSTSIFENARSTLKSLGDEDVVHVGEYLVPLDFAEVIEFLFDKYGDFGAKCTCSPEAKQYLFVGLCKALRSMYNTKVVRVSENDLIEWWTWLSIGKAAGFDIQFALQILERVVYAYFGLEADKYADGKLTRVRNIVRDVPGEVEELRRKMEELIGKKERELEEAVTEEKELREAAFRVKKSQLMQKCLTEAEDLVCYSVGELLLPLLEEG